VCGCWWPALVHVGGPCWWRPFVGHCFCAHRMAPLGCFDACASPQPSILQTSVCDCPLMRSSCRLRPLGAFSLPPNTLCLCSQSDMVVSNCPPPTSALHHAVLPICKSLSLCRSLSLSQPACVSLFFIPRLSLLEDIDGDGDLDVVTASFNDDTVSWKTKSRHVSYPRSCVRDIYKLRLPVVACRPGVGCALYPVAIVYSSVVGEVPRNRPMAWFGVPPLRTLFDHTCGSPRRSRTTRITGVCPLPSVQGWLCTPLPTARTVSQLETSTGTVTLIWWVFGTARYTHCTTCCVWKGGCCCGL
jgi:hypothetical protein